MNDLMHLRHLSLAPGDASKAEIDLAVEECLVAAEAANEAIWLELQPGAIARGFHPLIGRFCVSRKRDDAPAHLPMYLATLDPATYVHTGADEPEAALVALLTMAQKAIANGQTTSS